MEYNTSLPIYIQVVTAIKRDIVTGRLPLGEKMPSVRELAVQYTINPNTASRVYKELEAEDICFTKRGMGTFVTEDPEIVKAVKRTMAEELVREYLEGMRHLGVSWAEAVKMAEESSRTEYEKNAE